MRWESEILSCEQKGRMVKRLRAGENTQAQDMTIINITASSLYLLFSCQGAELVKTGHGKHSLWQM